ncbi:MAG: hypothetical protein NT126_09970, partial [Bacteroidetes bacterium]|nr:hypothetical protein [Bacteroidota bacterium]
LKKEEIKSLVNFLQYNQNQGKETRLKSVQLVESLLSKKNLTSNELQLTLYGKSNEAAFNKLVLRLKDKIYEILLFDDNLEKTINSKRNKVIFDIRKKLIQSEIMFSRGINFELDSFQNKIIQKAKEYEVYDSLLEALLAKQRYLGFRFGSNKYEEIKKEIELYEYNRIALGRSRELYNSLTTKISFSNSPDDYYEELSKAIDILQSDFIKTKSANIGYYFYFLQTEKFQIHYDLLGAKKSLMDLLQLIENNPSIYTENRKGSTLMNVAVNEILIFDFDTALIYVNRSSKYFSGVDVNMQILREIEFYSLFYSNKLNEAGRLIDELYNSSRLTGTPFIYNKRTYLYACLMTINGKNHESNALLKEVSEIERDKEGWNIGKRILTIINRIELKEFESADLQVQNLQKHIKRTLKIKHVQKRNILILRILLKLINEQYDFKKVYLSRNRYFGLLESNEDEYRWKIKSPELIIFHAWFKCKAENKAYDPHVALQYEKEKFLKHFSN